MVNQYYLFFKFPLFFLLLTQYYMIVLFLITFFYLFIFITAAAECFTHYDCPLNYCPSTFIARCVKSQCICSKKKKINFLWLVSFFICPFTKCNKEIYIFKRYLILILILGNYFSQYLSFPLFSFYYIAGVRHNFKILIMCLLFFYTEVYVELDGLC